MDPDALVADLDADQRRAVTTASTLVAVIAGAGSGKTRVLTRRVAHRIATGEATAAHTLVLTFSREAAGELRRRLPRLGLVERVAAGTFHAVARGILHQRWIDLDQRPREILDDRRRFVRALLGSSELDALLAEMSWATARGLSASAFETAVRHGGHHSALPVERVAVALERYAEEKRRRHVIDLDDLLTLTIADLERDDGFATALRWRYRHLLVDEAQDLTPVQHRLIDLLRSGNDDVYLVGDPAQAIYGFNGSDPTLLLEVSDRFPGIEIIRLPVNHRCTPQVVAAGTHVLDSAGQPTDAISARADGPAVVVASAPDEAAEAAMVARQIARADPAMVSGGHVAVLARTHVALAEVRNALASAGVAVLHAADDASAPTAVHLRDAYRQTDPVRMRQWVQDAFERSHDEHGTVIESALVLVATAALDFLREQPTGDGVTFRTWVSASNPFDDETNGVEVLTFHAAKGREWESVYLVGCETGLMPHRSARTVQARSEEARLLYVAVTRSTNELHISWAERRQGYARKLTPLLTEFDGAAPPRIPPPMELLSRAKSPRQAMLERLDAWRDGVARAAGIVPNAVVPDRALSLIADARPASAAELDEVTGIGPITSRRLFPGIETAMRANG
ncbi:MAG TPA: ATP-dependent DNA helicase UvrD2 [Ilumatobacter sp.]|nr:ATP-dependent DNA helicase UvrD2 [Ilumatobacter sp.]